MMKKVLITGDRGFISTYLVQKFLDEGFFVTGIDNNWKYGPQEKEFDNNINYKHIDGDAKDENFLKELVNILQPDYIIAAAAIIGGISLFHKLAYDLICENERIMASTFNAALDGHKQGYLKRIIVISSSMVYESTTKYPTPEGEAYECPPPISTYGFQKLSCEYFAKGAFEQYGLPYTIVRPFNCVGIGEKRANIDEEVMSGNIKLAMSHVIPDLIQKIVKGQNPLHILGDGTQIRHYTYGGDIAEGIYQCTIQDAAKNEIFNISTKQSTTVLELSKMIWKKIHGESLPFAFVSDDPFLYDVQKRIPDTTKAKELLGFEANTTLDEALDIVIPWVTDAVEKGMI